MELQSRTFEVPEVTFDAIQECLEQLFYERRARPSHLFVSQADYDALTDYFCTFTRSHIVGFTIVTEMVRIPQKVVQVVNVTTGDPMQFDVSPKLAKGIFAVLYKEK